MTHGTKLLFRLGFLLLLLGAASGCHTMGPKMPKVLGAPAVTSYTADDFKKNVQDYRAAVNKPDLPQARVLRDQIAYRVMAEIELDYGRFEMTLTTNRAAFQTGSDVVQLGLAAAIAVTPAGDVTNILAASLAGFKGTTLSIDKNFFEQKTTEALISQMRANRKTIQAQLLKSLATRDVTSYPLESLWVDLVDFYYAGTVPSALVSIAGNAGTQATKASADLAQTVAELTPATPAQAKEAVDIRSAYSKLAAAAQSADQATSEAAIANLKAILVKIGKDPGANPTVQDLLAELRQAMSDARADAAKLTALDDAIQAADIK